MLSKLKSLGFINPVYAGFQFDLNSVLKKTFHGFSEGHLCDHNCTTDCGNYDCPAAFSRNKDILKETMMSYPDLLTGLQTVKKGLTESNRYFLDKLLPSHAKAYKFPDPVMKEIVNVLNQGQVELNLFGGNPELYPNFLELIENARQMGWQVTATTTGKKFMYDDEFTEKFLEHPPNLLAISADDYENLDELKRLLEMSPNQIKTYWQKANPLYGQRKKAYESMYVAKISGTDKRFPQILFNIVVHPGNIGNINQMLKIIHENFPDKIVNPYPAQSSFLFGTVGWSDADLRQLRDFISQMVQAQVKQAKDGTKLFTPRLPYWLALQSIFSTYSDVNIQKRMISGFGVWKCFANGISARYFQATSADITQTELFKPGGHPGCFWNNTTVNDKKTQIWNLKPEEIRKYIFETKIDLAKVAVKPCPGCLMPRLMFDGLSVEAGLNQALLPEYLKYRKKYFDF
jgi:organic radical activating enzyme